MNEKFATVLADVFELKSVDIKPELKKEDIGSWDSLKQMDLVISLEREYCIELDIPDILQMTSIANIVAVLRSKGVDLGA